MAEVEENSVEEEVIAPEPDMPVVPLFGKWDLTEVNIEEKPNPTEQHEDDLPF